MLKWNKTRIFKDTIFNKNTLRMFSENIDFNKLISKHIKLKYSQKQLMFTFKELRQHDFKELKNLYNIPPNEIKKVKEMQDKSKSVDSLNNFLSNAKVNIFQLNKVCSIIRKEKLKTHAGVISTIVGSNHIENVQTAVGLRMGINNVSWCEVNLNNSNLDVLCWKSKTFYNVDSSADPLEMMKIGTAIANSIQKTNNYIMERDKITLKLPKSNSTLYRLVLRQQQIASVVLTTLFKTNASETYNDSNTTCFMMRPLTTARCFNLYHGVETVSSEYVFKAILRNEYKGLKNISSININDDILHLYKLQNKYVKEELNMVLLLTIAFFEKGVLKK